MTAPFVLPLADTSAVLATVGGKGASLARLAQAGLPVPDGFHVTTDAYRRFVAVNALWSGIRTALETVDPAQPATLEAASARIHDLFAAGTIPDDVATAIEAAYAGLPEGPVAVRSSATAEDLPELSFAGQQETYLNVRGVAAVHEAVRNCWASLWTARAIGYRAQHAIEHVDVSLAVVVQRLVAAEAAGILFTADPVSGRRDRAVLSAAWGLGEAVVSGQVTPDTFVIDKATGRVLERTVADKRVMTVRTATGTREEAVPDALRLVPALSDAHAAALNAYGNQIEALYACPMDIEWALSVGALSILQARPITALPENLPPVPTEWPRPNPKAYYARGSLAEHVPNPVSPLFGSLGVRRLNQATHELAERMFVDARAIDEMDYAYRIVNGYVFLSIAFTPRAIWAWTKATGQFTRLIFANARANWLAARDALSDDVNRWDARSPADLAPDELLRGAGELMLAAGRFYTVIQAGTLPTASSSEIVFGRAYALVRRPGDPPAETLLFGNDTIALRAEKSLFDLAGWCRTQADLASVLLAWPTATLVAATESGQAPSRVAPDVWAAWCARFSAHLKAFSRTAYDFDFVSQTPGEMPTTVLEAVRVYVEHPERDPYVRQRQALEHRDQFAERLRGRFTWIPKRWFERAWAWALDMGPTREDSIADMGTGHGTVRRLLLELGRRFVTGGALDSADDVFWLLEDECVAMAAQLERAEALADCRERVRARRAEWRAQSRANPPALLPERTWWRTLFPWSRVQAAGRVIKGLGTSAGTVTAPARVVLGPEDFGRMHAGDVLVAVTTTPAWTPLFTLASAVVTDIGGPLSHSSIVAREYGIPAVMATGEGTRRIHDGDLVTVDGGAGTVLLTADS